MIVRAELVGAARLSASLRKLGRDLADTGSTAAAVAQRIASAARARAPRRTGRLAGSIRVTRAGTAVTVAASASYAGPINYGVGRRPGLRGPHNIRASRYWSTSAALRVAEPLAQQAFTADINHKIAKVKGA